MMQYPAVAKTIGRLFEDSGFKLTGEDTSYIEKPLFLEILLNSVARRSRLRSAASSFKVEDDLQSGFRQDSFETMPDFGWDDADPEHQKLLPMRESLKKLSLVIHKWRWTPNQSVFKLIIMLCLPKMKEILGTANLIPQNSEKINEIACWYAKEGKLIELAIILMLALEKVKDPIIFQIKGESSKRCITLQQFINSELAQAIDLEYRLIGRTTKQERNLSKLCKQKKFTMLSALTLLEIFEKAGLAIEAYLRSERKNVQKEEVIKHISNLLLEAGFKLKSKDIELCNEVDCSPEVTSEVQDEVMEDQVKNSGVLLNLKNSAEMAAESGGQRQDTKRLSYVLPGGFVESSAAHDRALDMRKFLFARYPAEYPVLPSSAQSFRAFWTSKASKACYCTGIPKAMEVQPRDSVRAANQLLRKFAASKKVVSVTLAVKRRLKYA